MEEGVGRYWPTHTRLLRAQALPDWLSSRDDRDVRSADVPRLGPAPTRVKTDAAAAIDVLKTHGWAEEASARPRAIRRLAVN